MRACSFLPAIVRTKEEHVNGGQYRPVAVPRSQRLLCVVRTAGKPGAARQADHRCADADGQRRRDCRQLRGEGLWRRLCPAVIPVQARHRIYTEYHERILQAVDTCVPVEKVCSIDEVACRLMGTERQVAVARELAFKLKTALRTQVGECLTCSIGLAPNVFLGKVASDMQKPNGLVVITKADLPEILLGLELQEIYGIGDRMKERLHHAGIFTVAELWEATPFRLRRIWGGINGLLFHQMLHGVDIQPPSSRYSKSIGHQHVLEPELRTSDGAKTFSQHL